MHTSVARIFITSFSSIELHCTVYYTPVHPCTVYTLVCTSLATIVHHCIKLYKMVYTTLYLICHHCPPLPQIVCPVNSPSCFFTPVQLIIEHFTPVQLIIENVHLSLTRATISLKLLQLNFKIYIHQLKSSRTSCYVYSNT